MLVCYPQPGKARSLEVLEAFAAGSGGAVRMSQASRLEAGAAAFYGHVGLEHLVRQAMAGREAWYYGDNAFFDRCRGTHFRFGRNELQLSRLAPPAPERLKALGIAVKPWQRNGRHVLVVEQSAGYLRMAGEEGWLERTLLALRACTGRFIVVRHWMRDKAKASATLQGELANAHALVTHMSGAATEALLAGVPVFVTGDCAAKPLASGALSNIETPTYPDGREEWAAGLAGRQWTIEEIRRGAAWEALLGFA